MIAFETFNGPIQIPSLYYRKNNIKELKNYYAEINTNFVNYIEGMLQIITWTHNNNNL